MVAVGHTIAVSVAIAGGDLTHDAIAVADAKSDADSVNVAERQPNVNFFGDSIGEPLRILDAVRVRNTVDGTVSVSVAIADSGAHPEPSADSHREPSAFIDIDCNLKSDANADVAGAGLQIFALADLLALSEFSRERNSKPVAGNV